MTTKLNPGKPDGIGNLIARVKQSVRAYYDDGGCTEQGCGCCGSLIANAVEEAEKQYKEVLASFPAPQPSAEATEPTKVSSETAAHYDYSTPAKAAETELALARATRDEFYWKCEKLEAENVTLRRERDQLKETLDLAVEDTNELDKEVAKLESQVRELTAQLALKVEVLAESERINEQVGIECEELRAAVEKLLKILESAAGTLRFTSDRLEFHGHTHEETDLQVGTIERELSDMRKGRP